MFRKDNIIYMPAIADRIRGCIIGGAIGDALGFPIRDYDIKTLKRIYGENGVTELEKHIIIQKALISEVTQITMFAACGIIRAKVHFTRRNYFGSNKEYVRGAYHDWVLLQTNKRVSYPNSWIVCKDELKSERGADYNFVEALIAGLANDTAASVIDSKNSGGIAHLAPLPLAYIDFETNEKLMWLDNEAVEIVKLTYGNPKAYIPAITLNRIIHYAVGCSRTDNSLKNICYKALCATEDVFAKNKYWNDYAELINRAISYTDNEKSDIDNIQSIGAGWDADKALAIAIYCSIKYSDDFKKGIVAAVNHSGDSSSTGAITGNILGAWLGYNSIEEGLKDDLELIDTLMELADDLTYVNFLNGKNKIGDNHIALDDKLFSRY